MSISFAPHNLSDTKLRQLVESCMGHVMIDKESLSEHADHYAEWDGLADEITEKAHDMLKDLVLQHLTEWAHARVCSC